MIVSCVTVSDELSALLHTSWASYICLTTLKSYVRWQNTVSCSTASFRWWISVVLLIGLHSFLQLN